MSSPFIVFSFCLSPTQCRLKTLSGLFKLVESEVEAANVVEDLWSHFGLHLVLEDPGGCLVTLEALSEVILLQDLSQLNPSLNILRKLLRDLLQMILSNLPFLLVAGAGVQRSKNLHRLIIPGLRLENLLEALARVLSVAPVDVHLAQTKVGQHEG